MPPSGEHCPRPRACFEVASAAGHTRELAGCAAAPSRAVMAAAAPFDPEPRPRFAGSASLAFYAAAPKRALTAPERRLTPQPRPASPAAGSGTHYELRLR